jgi:hypothetical protein
MPKKYTVKPGDCVANIAASHGFFPDTLWDHADNSELKKLRGDPHVLSPGDVVVIPDKTEKEEDCGTESSHRFRRKSVPEKFQVQLMDWEDKPLSDLDYRFWLDGKTSEGTTDADGKVDEWIPPGAKMALVTFTESGDEYEFDLGGLQPIDTLYGVKQRLVNIGAMDASFLGRDDSGPDDDEQETLAPGVQRALSDYALANGLEWNGEVTDELRDMLKIECGG